MKRLNVILFNNDDEIAIRGNKVCEKLSRDNLSHDQEFCGIWGEIQLNNEECLNSICATVNYFLNSDNNNEVFFGCCEKDYINIISRVQIKNCSINVMDYHEI